VIVLHPIERLSKGDPIYAVYPDTTSFYPATVVVATKKQSILKQQQQQGQVQQPIFVMVQFVDDADESGITHDKAVPIQHIMIPPPQLLL
jgi:SGF29 tudor-like domain